MATLAAGALEGTVATSHMPGLKGLYSRGAGSLLGARYLAAGTAGAASLLLEDNWENKLGGVAFALADPIADLTAARIVTRAITEQGKLRPLMGKIYEYLGDKASDTTTMASKGKEWKSIGSLLNSSEKIQKDVMSRVRLTGRTIASPLLAIPLWVLLNAGLKTVGKSIDNHSNLISSFKSTESRNELSTDESPPISNPIATAILNYKDNPIDMNRVDEMYSNYITRGTAA